MERPTDTPILRAEGLGKRVTSPEGTLEILAGTDLSMAPGESLAVIGESGSGKSTLLSLLAGLDTPSEGRVWIDGTDLTALGEDGRARLRGRLVGFVFQSFQLIPSLTALENVMLPLELAGGEDPRGAALEVLDRVGLGARVRHYPSQLSGGEQQRVALARAFSTRPRLLFADEPTGNLDRRTGERVRDLLFRMNAEQATTLVLVTHDPGLAEHCERTLRLEGGRLHPEPRAAGLARLAGA
ncbi:MAG: ABC transporter ATP-binding protein [Gammaproteobacteria bacterium]|jgi:putative ABC transport system ATP-binding protein|nr:ABC transporter ATP-binding protein [Gammaproteobacteria bacterium]